MRMKKEQWQDVIDLNLTGVFLCTQVQKIYPNDCSYQYRVCITNASFRMPPEVVHIQGYPNAT